MANFNKIFGVHRIPAQTIICLDSLSRLKAKNS